MKRSVAIGNFVQSAIFGWGAWWLGERWMPAAALIGMCALAQLVGGALLLAGKGDRLVRWAALVTMIGAAIVLGMFLDTTLHLQEAYGSDARKLGRNAMWSTLACVPWAFAFPTWQLLTAGGLRRLWVVAVALVLPAIGGLLDGPIEQWPAQHAHASAAQAAFDRWVGTDPSADIPTGVGPATVLLTPWGDGIAGTSVRGNGDSLAAAIEDALDRLKAPTDQRNALVVDVARQRYPVGAPVPAGQGGGLSKRGGTSPTVAWRPGKISYQKVAPRWSLPRPKIGKQWPTRFDSVVTDTEGTRPIVGGWSAPPRLTAQTALDAAKAGGAVLVHHQKSNGKFAYTVGGPSGKPKGKGYNFPRHAGATWFLARLAQRTGDAEIGEAADRALAYMAEHTIDMGDGRAYLHDPKRKDGRTWAGTTALAALAAQIRGHPLAESWGRWLASSIDARGQVLGEMRMETGEFRPQRKNPYGQGQVALALASLVRGGQEELREAAERTAQFFDGDYAPGGVGRLVVLDEHWTCLAAYALRDVFGSAHGMAVCQAYLANEHKQTPSAGDRVRPHSGSGGGLAEAVVAGAILDPDGPYRERALAFGEMFLRNAYRDGDAPFLPLPQGLIGGFRDSPYRLDIRMDAVQHIGCALLGIEALLSQQQPGSYP